MSSDWRKNPSLDSFPNTNTSSSETGISSKSSYGLANNTMSGLGNPINFEQFRNSPERLLKMQQLMESGVG